MNGKTEKVKTVKGLKGSVAQFVRPRDGVLIHVFPRKGEARAQAIVRVMSHNGAIGHKFSLVEGTV